MASGALYAQQQTIGLIWLSPCSRLKPRLASRSRLGWRVLSGVGTSCGPESCACPWFYSTHVDKYGSCTKRMLSFGPRRDLEDCHHPTERFLVEEFIKNGLDLCLGRVVPDMLESIIQVAELDRFGYLRDSREVSLVELHGSSTQFENTSSPSTSTRKPRPSS